jgi:hypothetical protein
MEKYQILKKENGCYWNTWGIFHRYFFLSNNPARVGGFFLKRLEALYCLPYDSTKKTRAHFSGFFRYRSQLILVNRI